jgi:hypothetical protein
MVKRFKDKINHPFWGKHHDENTKLLISKPGVFNPMYGKTHKNKLKVWWELIKENTLMV